MTDNIHVARTGIDAPNGMSIRGRILQIAALFLLVSFLLQGIAYFQSETMDSVRSYVRGEGLWAKAQKDAVYYLLDYIHSKKPGDYQKFRKSLEVPLGDRKARELMQAGQFDFETIRPHFLQGQNHSEDIAGMIRFFHRFEHFPYMSEAIVIWRQADEGIEELIELGSQVKLAHGLNDDKKLQLLLGKLERLNKKLNSLEYDFSYVLSEGARWVKNVLMMISVGMLVLVLIPVILISRKIIAGIERTERELRISENRFSTLFQSDMVGIVEWHGDGRILDANENFVNMLGYHRRDVESGQLNWRRLTPEEGYERDEQALKEIAEKGYCRPFEKEFLAIDKKAVPVLLGAALYDGDQQRGIAFVIDQTVQRQAQTELKLSAAVFDNSKDGILITDNNLQIITTNRALAELTGYQNDDVAGKRLGSSHSGLIQENFFEEIWRSLIADGYWQGDTIETTKTGETLPVHVRFNAVTNGDDVVTHYVVIFTDISERKEVETKLRKMAHYDFLTGLMNRSLFNDLLSSAISRAKRSASMFALLFIDLDRFKPVNDRFGHEVGDQLLCEIAARLKSNVREHDVVARMGGDEFVVMLEDLKQINDASHVAKNVIASINKVVQVEDHQLHVGCSIGISLFPVNGDNALDLLNAADVAMYAAKAAGRNQFYFFNKDKEK